MPPTLVATSHLVMVAVDDSGEPRAVPRLVPETDDDRRAFARAGIRRQHRLALRAALAADS